LLVVTNWQRKCCIGRKQTQTASSEWATTLRLIFLLEGELVLLIVDLFLFAFISYATYNVGKDYVVSSVNKCFY
jgi:hypothetical protein